MRPVSKTMRCAAGALASSAAIAAGDVAALASWTTLPSRSTTQMCVSFIEMSKPAKYSMAAPPVVIQSRFYRLHGEQPSHYPMLKNSANSRAAVHIDQPRFGSPLALDSRPQSGHQRNDRFEGGCP